MNPPVADLLERLSSAIHDQDLAAGTDLWCEDAVLAGTDEDELAVGSEIPDFLKMTMSLGVRLRWEWQEPIVRQAGPLAWFYAEGQLCVEDTKPRPYRCSGVAREEQGRWRLALWHGAQPA